MSQAISLTPSIPTQYPLCILDIESVYKYPNEYMKLHTQVVVHASILQISYAT